jgi:hypothetical protein
MRFFCLALIVASAVRASAQSTPAAPLGALDFFVGSCWSGQGPKGDVDRHCFTRAYGYFVRDVHEVTGAARPYGGETLYHWDAKAGVVRFTYWNTVGGVSTGTMTVKGRALVFPETYEGKDGRRIEMRNVWSPEGPDSYVATVMQKKDDTWVEVSRRVFKRTSDAVAPKG